MRAGFRVPWHGPKVCHQLFARRGGTLGMRNEERAEDEAERAAPPAGETPRNADGSPSDGFVTQRLPAPPFTAPSRAASPAQRTAVYRICHARATTDHRPITAAWACGQRDGPRCRESSGADRACSSRLSCHERWPQLCTFSFHIWVDRSTSGRWLP